MATGDIGDIGGIGGIPTSDLHDDAAARLAARDLRYTAARRALVDVLAAADRPVTLPQILAADRALSQSSAYRNLGELTQAGVVSRILVDDGFAYFELAEGLRHHHHHVVCTTCGRIDDFTASPALERELHRTLTQVADGTGFDVADHRLDLLGTCADCR